MTRTIEIVITTEGKTTVQTLGFAGAGCRDASRFLEQALGQRTSEQFTPEFHHAAQSAEQAQQQRL